MEFNFSSVVYAVGEAVVNNETFKYPYPAKIMEVR